MYLHVIFFIYSLRFIPLAISITRGAKCQSVIEPTLTLCKRLPRVPRLGGWAFSNVAVENPLLVNNSGNDHPNWLMVGEWWLIIVGYNKN